MDVAAFWDLIRSALGLDEPRAAQTVAKAIERIIVPNTVVFSSIIENSSVGTLDRQKYSVDGVELPISEIQSAVIESLRGTPHLSHRNPIVDVIQASPEGTDIDVTVEHDLGHRIDDQVIDRLRTLFPEAAIATKTPVSTS